MVGAVGVPRRREPLEPPARPPGDPRLRLHLQRSGARAGVAEVGEDLGAVAEAGLLVEPVRGQPAELDEGLRAQLAVVVERRTETGPDLPARPDDRSLLEGLGVE